MRARSAFGTCARIEPTSSAVFAIVRPAPAVFSTSTRVVPFGTVLERVDDRRRDPLRRRFAIVVGRRAGMKAHRADAERRRALELLGEAVARARPLLLVRRRGVEHVRRVRDDESWIDLRLAERVAKARHALGSDRALVAVVLRDGGEDLQRAHARVARPARGHVDAAVVDRVCAEVVVHERESSWRVNAAPARQRMRPSRTMRVAPLSACLSAPTTETASRDPRARRPGRSRRRRRATR